MIDTVVDGVTGMHVPPRDPDALASALRYLLDRPSLRERLGRSGTARAEDRYGWDGVAASTLDAYGQVVNGRHAHAIAAGAIR
jgi:glycosyltransferase involved in cell wall biosynthesis